MLSQTFAYDPGDAAEVRRQKHAIFLVAGACMLAGGVWTAMYWLIFGWCLTTALPLAFVVIVGSSLIVSHRTRNHYYAVWAQILCIMYIVAFVQWSIGGVFESGFVLAWAFVGPVTALMFFSFRTSMSWFVLYLANVVITVAFDDTFERYGYDVDEATRHLFFAMNLCASSFVVLLFAGYYVFSAATERFRADALQNDLDEVKAKQLGAYTLGDKIGQGGMGTVFKARHALLRRPTAIKLLSTDKARPDDLARFELEVQMTSELTHPNIVAVYDYGRSPEGEFYYAMEYLPGVDLQSLVKLFGKLSPSRAVGILLQVCDALDSAHHRGLIHRDIKPANIILSRFGKRCDVAKVVDFGLVRELDGPSELGGAAMATGTPAYMAPETLAAPETVGPETDLYAVGAVAFFLMTGEQLFSGATAVAVCTHHRDTPPRPPSAVEGVSVPEALDEIVLRCLAKRPSDRYRSASSLRDAFDALGVAANWDRADAEYWWDTVGATLLPELGSEAAVVGHATTMNVDLTARY